MRHSIRKVKALEGISVCAEWQDYHTYEAWCYSHGWSRGKCVVRIDKSGDFCPSNCKIIPSRKYISVERRNVARLPDGRSTRDLCGWGASSKEFNLVRRRVFGLGWSVGEALSTPRNGI